MNAQGWIFLDVVMRTFFIIIIQHHDSLIP